MDPLFDAQALPRRAPPRGPTRRLGATPGDTSAPGQRTTSSAAPRAPPSASGPPARRPPPLDASNNYMWSYEHNYVKSFGKFQPAMILCDAYSPALRKAIPGDDQASDDNIVQIIVRHGFLRRGQVRHVVEHEHAGGGQAASPLRRRPPSLVLRLGGYHRIYRPRSGHSAVINTICFGCLCGWVV